MTLFDNDRQQEAADDALPGLERIARVTTPLLNIRSGPSASFDKVADPLKQDMRVKILDQDASWTKVRFSTEGWVSSKYLSKL